MTEKKKKNAMKLEKIKEIKKLKEEKLLLERQKLKAQEEQMEIYI